MVLCFCFILPRWGAVLIFPIAGEREEWRTKTEKTRGRETPVRSLDDESGRFTNEGPSQRFICSSFTFSCIICLRLNIAVDERWGTR